MRDFLECMCILARKQRIDFTLINGYLNFMWRILNRTSHLRILHILTPLYFWRHCIWQCTLGLNWTHTIKKWYFGIFLHIFEFLSLNFYPKPAYFFYIWNPIRILILYCNTSDIFNLSDNMYVTINRYLLRMYSMVSWSSIW